MKPQDPLLRSALWLQRCHQPSLLQPDRGHDSALETVLYHTQLLIQHCGASRKARSRHWHAAAAQMDAHVSSDLRQLQYAITQAQNKTRHPSVLPQVSLRDLYQELTQLQQEFTKVTVDPQHHLLAAVTDSIELEGIYLGEFRLELHLDRLNKRADLSAFDVVALDPHPAGSTEDVTHPHVRDNQLCAGDATSPIIQALKEGRFCDAFLAINAVLHEYNPHSPYVSLENWQGIACADCGSLTDEDQRYYCEDCGQDYCEDCFSTCQICDSSCCRGCLEQDRESGRSCCRSCRHNCQRCSRMVDADSFNNESQLCPACHELQADESPKPQEINNEQHDSDPIPQTSIVPGPEGRGQNPELLANGLAEAAPVSACR